VGLEARGIGRAARRDRSRRIMHAVGLAGFEEYYPHETSGGMRQRAAVARALVTEPEILLMDEPFASIDVLMKARLHAELARVLAEYKTTVLFVTHDIEEASVLADRVVVMSPRPGRVASIVPIELARPRDRLSADFVSVRRAVHETLRAAEAADTDSEAG
jgi:ABC-type nitrate/sulfonate/bicarbonate transport system ATPase subunit